MTKYSLFVAVVFFVCGLSKISAEPDPNFHIYLAFGQSNMAGGCNKPEDQGELLDLKEEDCNVTERVKVLAFTTCTNKKSGACKDLTLNREEGKWYDAFPPYNNCNDGVSPVNYFGKVLLDSINENISIGFIPCAFSGQYIDVFVKGSNATVPSWTHGGVTSKIYDWMLARCKFAQQKGVIKGIIFHQGESDTGSPTWVSRVKSVLDDLKEDLNLNKDIPIVVGELLQVNGACCASHNPLVNQLASEYPNTGVASTKDLTMRPNDQWKAHFDCKAMRELGRRYAYEFLKMADHEYIPRKNSVVSVKSSDFTPPIATMRSWNDGIKIYTFNGKHISDVESITHSKNWRSTLKGNAYIIYKKSTKTGKIVVAP